MTIDPTDLKWKCEDEMDAELESIKKTRDIKKCGTDGFVVAANGEFSHLGIKYLIKVLRYFTFNTGWIPMSDRASIHHCVVEFPEETRPIVDLLNRMELGSEFLWHDTLHSYTDNMNVEAQISECHRMAKEDIEELPTIVATLEGDIQKLKDFSEIISMEEK